MRKLRATLTRPQEAVNHTRTDTVTEPRKCRHYWLIESSPGCVSKGMCKICGEKKEFVNCLSDSWSDINFKPPAEAEPSDTEGDDEASDDL